MKPENKKQYRDFLEDPAGELPQGLQAELSSEELREAGRHQELDRKLRRALGELSAAADKRSPALSEKAFKENLLKAIQPTAADSATDELAYLRKMRGRDLAKRFVERPAYSMGAVAALLAVAFLPFVYQSQFSDQSAGSVAMNEASAEFYDEALDEEVEGMRLGAPAPVAGSAESAAASKEEKTNTAPALAQKETVSPAAPQKADAATAPAEALAMNEAKKRAKANADEAPVKVEEEVAMLSRGMPAPAGDSIAPSQAKPESAAPANVPLDIKLRVREKMLTQKVKIARDKDAKRKALQQLEAFYKQHGQTAKQQNVKRQIDALN